jgi:hypothetical protein
MLSLGTVFWIIIIILVLFFGAFYSGLFHPAYVGINNLVELVLFCLLGWAVFGPPIRGTRN